MSNNIYVLSPNDCEWWFAGQGTYDHTLRTVKEWGEREGADLVFNLGVFDLKTGASYTYVAGPKMVTDPSGLTDPKIGGKSNVLVLDNVNKCKGYSNGIVNGTVKVNAPMGGKRTRNGVGITTSGWLIEAQCSDKITEAAFCNAVNAYVKAKRQAVKLFVLEDGGGSTTSWSFRANSGFNPEPDNKKRPNIFRPCATVLCVKFKRTITLTHPIYVGCPKDEQTEMVQIVVGGLAADRDYGNLSKTRMTAVQAALGMPKGMQNGVADYSTLKKLGFKCNF